MSFEDIAQDVELKDWERNNTRRPQPTYQPGEAGYGPEFCEDEDCGAVMPVLRRAYGYCLCVDCQSIAESRQKRRL